MRLLGVPKSAAVLIGMVAAAVASFSVVSVLSQSGPTADPAAVATLQADSEKPRLTGTVISGIRLYGGGADQGPEATCSQPFEPLDYPGTGGTPFEISPSYLPSGLAEASPGAATACGKSIVSSGRTWGPAPGGPGKGLLQIQRVLRPESWNYSHAPADRVSSGQVKGKPVVLVESPIRDGRGLSVVSWADPVPNGFVVTQILGTDIPLSELIKVAEGMLQ
jgi:hypothetical protein